VHPLVVGIVLAYLDIQIFFNLERTLGIIPKRELLQNTSGDRRDFRKIILEIFLIPLS
jgi:hypothetical protein